MARPPFAVTDAVREKVRYLAGVGVRQDDIAKIIGCSPKTLRKRCRDELDRGVAEANATMFGYLFAAAKGGNIAAIIFWLENESEFAGNARQPGPRRRCRVGVAGGPRAARQLPRSRADPSAAGRPRKIFRRETTATAPKRRT